MHPLRFCLPVDHLRFSGPSNAKGDPTVDDIALYLAKNKGSFKSDSPVEVREDPTARTAALTVVVLSSGENQIVIGHLGREFIVRDEDVFGITDAPENAFNYFARGRPALITLRREATLVQREIISVSALELGQPFAVASRTTASATLHIISNIE